MLSCVDFLAKCIGKILIFIGNIEVDPGVNIASLILIVAAVGLIIGFLLGPGRGVAETYQPRHSYAPKHARKE